MSDEPETLRGQLLIAAPSLLDPNFHRTVVLVTAHTDEGAMGLVLNRPSEVTVADGVPHLEDLVEEGARVHVGGPVEPSAVVALAEFEDADESAALVFGDVGFLPPDPDADALGATTRRVRIFAGYAGWAPGQLEGELTDEAWFLETAEADEVFSGVPDELWASVLRRKGGQFALIATMPSDPSVN